jgi:hypothetical protein
MRTFAAYNDVRVLACITSGLVRAGALGERQDDPRMIPAGVRRRDRGSLPRAGMEERDGVLYFNPGSAGPRRFRLPVRVGRSTVRGTRVTGEVIELSV